MQFGGAQLRQEAADRAAARAADRTVYRCPSCGGGGEPAIDPATCQAFCGSCGYVGGAVADFVVRVKRATAKTSAKAEGRKR